MKGYKRILLILLTLIYGCIDPIELDISEEIRILVVEGFISTGPGPHRIKLSKSGKYGDLFKSVIRNEVRADVWIRDNVGNVTILKEVSPGWYDTPEDWHAELHKSYTLNIITNVGAHYISSPETVVPVAPIDSLILQYKKISTANPFAFLLGVEVFARFQDPPDSRDFYIWRNNANFSVNILDDKNSNGTINTALAAYLQEDGEQFTNKYMVIVQQLSISKEAHAFIDLLKKQLSIDGDIFDPPPATIRGNMINLDRQEENVIGYFHASDVSIDTVFIDRRVLKDLKSQAGK